jgi:hypothetical protein
MAVAALGVGIDVPGAVAEGYGAIAFSRTTGAIGWGFDYPSREAAEQGAVANCVQHAGDCAVATWFRDACGAIAVGDGHGFGAEWGEEAQSAEAAALRTCRSYTGNCTVRRSVCTTR